MPLTFGWRIPDFPVDGADAGQFRAQIFDYLDALHGHLETAWAGDHFFPWMDTIDQTEDTIEAFSTLTYILGRYPRLKAGSIVLSQGYRPPALLAKMAANLQWLSGGRFILGIGAGWKENEYHAYGYDFPPPGQRIAQFEEAAQVIRKMWSEDAPAFQGRYYSIQDAYCFPRPDPAPPLLIGGHGRRKTLRVAAKYADMLNFNNVTAAEYRELLGVFEQHCQAVGRNPTEIVKTFSAECAAVASSQSGAERLLAGSPFGQWDMISGTPDEAAARIQAYADLGVRHIILRFPDFPATQALEIFIKEVMPRF